MDEGLETRREGLTRIISCRRAEKRKVAKDAVLWLHYRQTATRHRMHAGTHAGRHADRQLLLFHQNKKKKEETDAVTLQSFNSQKETHRTREKNSRVSLVCLSFDCNPPSHACKKRYKKRAVNPQPVHTFGQKDNSMYPTQGGLYAQTGGMYRLRRRHICTHTYTLLYICISLYCRAYRWTCTDVRGWDWSWSSQTTSILLSMLPETRNSRAKEVGSDYHSGTTKHQPEGRTKKKKRKKKPTVQLRYGFRCIQHATSEVYIHQVLDVQIPHLSRKRFPERTLESRRCRLEVFAFEATYFRLVT